LVTLHLIIELEQDLFLYLTSCLLSFYSLSSSLLTNNVLLDQEHEENYGAIKTLVVINAKEILNCSTHLPSLTLQGHQIFALEVKSCYYALFSSRYVEEEFM